MTREQQQILSHDIQPDHVVKIMALAGAAASATGSLGGKCQKTEVITAFRSRYAAGTGKTSTLVWYAEQRPDLRFLYVAFNKSVAKEAERRFPRNVSCKTAHSLAFKDVGKK